MKFQAIETIYNGYKFRSRLEARWAVFFDSLGVKYEYEKEGYDLGPEIWYLPDFWIPEWDCFWEVKGESPTDEQWNKCNKLCDATEKLVLVCVGSPWPSEHHVQSAHRDFYDPNGWTSVFAINSSGGYCIMTETGLDLEIIDLSQLPQVHAFPRHFAYLRPTDPQCDTIRTAYMAARHARFEHGETPNTGR